jgi:hypothetical protein
VVLPLPLGPSIPNTWPLLTLRLILLTAQSLPKFLVRPLIESTVSKVDILVDG